MVVQASKRTFDISIRKWFLCSNLLDIPPRLPTRLIASFFVLHGRVASCFQRSTNLMFWGGARGDMLFFSRMLPYMIASFIIFKLY